MDGHSDLARRIERPLHPRTHVRHVVAGEVHPAVGLLQRDQRLVRRGCFGPP